MINLKNSQYVKVLAFVFGILLATACSSNTNLSSDEEEEAIETEEPTNTDYDITSILNIFDAASDVVTYRISGDYVIITTTALPDHNSPYYLDTAWESEKYQAYNGGNSSFRMNPNRIGEKSITLTIPLHPKAAANKESTPMGAMGISRNGIPFFNQYAAGGSPLTNEINSFDQHAGHPTGSSTYHYHIEPTFLTEKYGEDAILGILIDGFPVYGPVQNGASVTNDDLDDYHGHYGVTDDFPNGIYHYHITNEDPYINGDGFYGTPGNVTN